MIISMERIIVSVLGANMYSGGIMMKVRLNCMRRLSTVLFQLIL